MDEKLDGGWAIYDMDGNRISSVHDTAAKAYEDALQHSAERSMAHYWKCEWVRFSVEEAG